MLFEAPTQPGAPLAPSEPAAAPEPEQPPPPEPSPPPEPAPAVVAAPQPPPRPEIRPRHPAPAAPASAAPAAPAPAAPAEAGLSAPVGISPDWRDAVAAWLQAHKTYPYEARRRGQEGQARVRFTIARDGRVLDAVILDATGSVALDRAVGALLDALRQSRFPFPAAMTLAEITQTVNIRYTLESGAR